MGLFGTTTETLPRPEAVKAKIKDKQEKLRGLAGELHEAEATLEAKKEAYVRAEFEAEMGGDADVEAARQEYEAARASLQRLNDEVDDRAEALHEVIGKLEETYRAAWTAQAEEQAGALHEKIEDKAAALRATLEEARALNDELAELEHEAHAVHMNPPEDRRQGPNKHGLGRGPIHIRGALRTVDTSKWGGFAGKAASDVRQFFRRYREHYG